MNRRVGLLVLASCLAVISPARAQVGPTGAAASSTTATGVATACGASTNQLLYDNAGSCSGLATINSGVLITSGSGAPSIATTLPSGLTVPSPTMTTPTLGVATATTINKVTLTAPATGSTLTISDGKTLTASNSLTLAGTDSTTMTFPTTSATIARTDAANTFTGSQTFSGQIVTSTGTPTIASGACGTGTNGAVVAGSTNQSGQITIGASATTSCTLSWSATLGSAPKSCVFFPMNATAAATGTTVARVGAPSTTQVVLSGSALASANYAYICL